MPKEELLSALPDLFDPAEIPTQVKRLAQQYEVSFEAMVRRLIDLHALRKDLGEWLLSGVKNTLPSSESATGETCSSPSETSKVKTHFFPRPPEKGLPVISPEEAFPYNQEFRYPGDPPHWIRLRQPPPEGQSSSPREWK
jgi:hypothetical protein